MPVIIVREKTEIDVTRKRGIIMNKALLAFCTIAVALSITGCATQTIQNAEKFAQAGVAFSDAIPPVLDESFKRSVQVDSQVLLEVRPDLASMSKKERFNKLKPHNDALMKRANLLMDIKRHSQVLKAYFVALQSLATSDAPSKVGEETTSLVAEASKINDNIKKALEGKTFSGATLGDVIPKAGTYIVTGIKAGALKSELEEHGPAIERELATFEGVLKLLERIAIEENNTVRAQQLKNNIDKPFIADGNIPADWASRRIELFWNATQTPAITNAKKAAQLLRVNFISVMEGRSTSGGIASLIRAITELAAVFAPAEQSQS